MKTATLVSCSFNRLEALRDTLPNKLAVQGVENVVIVLDGSTDGSLEWLLQQKVHEPRLRVVPLPHGGVQRARRHAIEHVDTPWILFIDDDDMVPDDYAFRLIEAAVTHRADFVSAPWINCTERPLQNALAEARLLPSQSPSRLGDHPSSWPAVPTETPFHTGNFCVTREAMESVQDLVTKYPVNGWREETDMFLAMWGHGFRGIKTDESFSWCEQRYVGGQRSAGRMKYELAVATNEFRFWRSNRRILRELAELRGPWFIRPAREVAARWAELGRVLLGTRLSRVRGRG